MYDHYPPALPTDRLDATPHRTGGGSRCEFYLGQNAGTELLQDLQRARRSIVVVTPYTSPEFIERLMERQRSGVHVTLVTMSDASKSPRLGEMLVHQDRATDPLALRRRRIGSRTGGVLMAIGVLVALAQATQGSLAGAAVGIATALFAGCGYHLARTMRIYSYSYRYTFPEVRVFESPYGRGHPRNEPRRMQVHSKVYVIDDEVAYLGSLNFTSSGMMHNYESSVRFTERDAVHRIRAMAEALSTTTWWETRSAATWGPRLFSEPAN